MNADEKRRVAYHEAGHALVACSLPNTHPVHKISIIPRGVGALGYVLSRPDEDRYLVTQSELESRIKVALGGTLAEELVYAEISNGATSDLEQVNDIARRMVKQFGMSRLGRVSFQEQNGPGFLGGRRRTGPRGYSEQTAREIDVEIRQIIDTATEQVPGHPARPPRGAGGDREAAHREGGHRRARAAAAARRGDAGRQRAGGVSDGRSADSVAHASGSSLHLARRPPALARGLREAVAEVRAHARPPASAGAPRLRGARSATFVFSPMSASRSYSAAGVFACFVVRGLPVLAGRLAAERAVGVREVELPLAAPHRLQLVVPVEEVRLVRTLRPRLAREQRPDVLAVDRQRAAASPRRGPPASAGCRWSSRAARHTLPAGILPGQRMTHGTRTPPSHVVILPSRSGPAPPAWLP